MAYTGMTEMPPAVRTYYDRTLLDEARSELIHDLFLEKKSIKLANGDQMLFRDIPDLPAVTTAISGITDPVAQALSKNDQTCTLEKFGAFITIEDEVEFTNENPILTVATERAGRQAGLSRDTLLRDYLNAGTNVMYAGGVAGRVNIASTVNDTDFYKIVRALARVDAKRFKKMIQPGTGVGSNPIPASYFAITHPDITFSVRGLDGFIPIEEYPKQQDVYPQEIGAHKAGIRFLESTNAKIFPDSGAAVGSTGLISSGTKVDVYTILVFGVGAGAIVTLDGHALETVIKDKKTAGSKLDLFSTVGWKKYITNIILRENRMLRFECGAIA
jgi:N4-gp56 family major capsid protein